LRPSGVSARCQFGFAKIDSPYNFKPPQNESNHRAVGVTSVYLLASVINKTITAASFFGGTVNSAAQKSSNK
jgi:hypothetical protein